MKAGHSPKPKSKNGGAPHGLSLLTVTLIFALGLGVLIGNKLMLYRNMTIVDEHEVTVQHTRQVLDELESTISSVKDAERGARGFVITAEDRYLAPYRDARAEISDRLVRLKSLIADNPEQLERVDNLEERIEAMLTRLAALVDITISKGSEAGQQAVRTGIGYGMMQELRAVANDIRTQEQHLLNQRTAKAREAKAGVNRALVISTIANVLILLIAYYFIRRDLTLQLRERRRLEADAWVKERLAELGEITRGNETEAALGSRVLDFFAQNIGVPVGTLYTFHEHELRLCAIHAGSSHLMASPTLTKGEGLAWAAVAQKRIILQKNLPDSYLKISSSLGDTPVRHLVIVPLLFENTVKGVMELGSLEPFQERDFHLFEHIEKSFGVSIDAAQSRSRTQQLLEETQVQAEELQAQQEELRASNEELEMQTQSLKSAQERLEIEQANLESVNERLQEKARALSQASAYKSEFMANMSHELRTPLNSLLILATLLYENEDGNLTEKQIEFAKTIHRSGTDLLALINDILDLSKVEAGRLEIHPEDFRPAELAADLERSFRHLAEQKGLSFEVTLPPELPSVMRSDRQRVEQVIKNFLSNAIKFTHKGSVRVQFETRGNDQVAVRVCDTGIGIPKEKQDVIFEAFQQADGSTSRQYGGTGLGLTISRELALLLGGHIEVMSTAGQGSVFTLVLPITFSAKGEDSRASGKTAPSHAERRMDGHQVTPWVEGDPVPFSPEDRAVVIVEDDVPFGRILLAHAREAGFKAILTNSGEMGLEMIEKHNVQGVLLDLRLPDVSGLSLLERLKSTPHTRHLPTHVISADDFSQNALKMGAMGYLVKPVTRGQIQDVFARLEETLAKKIKRVLVIEDDKVQRDAMVSLLQSGDIELDAAGMGSEAIAMLDKQAYDCIILDLRLPDMSGFELLKLLDAKDAPRPPVVVYTGKDLSKSEIDQLRKYSESIVLKGAKSPERLLDEVSLFLHRVESDLPSTSQSILRQLRTQEDMFTGRKILLVDDDMRNVFALANMLQSKGLDVVTARDGREALDILRSDPGIELVLMDIMMPYMDGYEAMAEIRKDRSAADLPILALTAKAMKGDQEKCLAAGANDYLAKPVNPERLLSLLRVWLPKSNEI